MLYALRGANMELLLAILVATSSGSKDGSNPCWSLIADLYTSVANSLFGTDKIKMAPPVSLDDDARVQIGSRVKIFHHASNLAVVERRIKFGEGREKGCSTDHAIPEV